MGFLTNFFTNVLNETPEVSTTNSFDELSPEQLEAHLEVVNYNGFVLTDAVRPSFDLKVVPREGFRHEVYEDENGQESIPVVMASVSREMLFEVFMDLIEPLGNVVDVVLETSHDRESAGHRDLYREHIDMPVLKSILWEHEDLLTNDGCTGIAVLNPHVPHEVQFDEHKLLIVYGNKLQSFEHVLDSHLVPCDEKMPFITEAEHVHSSNATYVKQFDELRTALGLDISYV